MAEAKRRHFRRQVVLALIQSPTVTVANVFQQKDLWAIADLIVASEPPEPDEPTRNEQKQRVDGFAQTDEET
jgi:hypothetical protein